MARLKVFRDPVHSNISFDTTSPTGKLVLSLIDTPQVQRLRHIRQLALANTVYHGAEHSRFSHTLGVVHLAKRMYEMAHVMTKRSNERDEYAIVLAAAVLHDIGHAPFSHAVEKVLDIKHEQLSLQLVQQPSEVHGILYEYGNSSGCGGDTFINAVSQHIAGKTDLPTIDIISSQLDADRLDYVLRDGYHAGVPNARFDLERILQTVELDEHGLIFDERGVYAIEGYFIARYHLYQQLYYHKTVRAANVLLRKVLERAKHLREMGKTLGSIDSTVAQLFTDDTAEAAIRLNDHDLWSTFRIWLDHDDPILQDLSFRLVNRQYLKSVDIKPRSTEMNHFYEEQLPRIKEVAWHHEFDPAYYIALDEANAIPYLVTRLSSLNDTNTSVRIRNNGRVELLEDRSSLILDLQRQVTGRVRVCFPEQIREDVNRIISTS